MDQLFTKVIRFIDHFGTSASTFSKEAWILLATVSVVFGFMMLRGNGGR